MLTKVEVLNNRGESLMLPLFDASGGYLVKDIDGLGPVKATLVSTKFARIAGAQLQSVKRPERNIVMKLGLETDWATNTVESLRNNLYNYLMPETQCTLRFYKDNSLFATINGVVESNEPSIFTQDPGADISIICYDPDFYALTPVVVEGATVSTTTETPIPYTGTTDVGGVLQVAVDRVANGFFVYNTRPGNVIQTFELSADLLAGDIVTVSSVERSKRVRLLRASTETSLLRGVSPSSSWISLAKGVNGFRVYTSGAPIPWTFTYLPKYGGL